MADSAKILNEKDVERRKDVPEKADGILGTADLDIPILIKDGMRLHPQPTSDPLDPLNWTAMRKNSILAIVMSLYFMFTYITTTTVPSFFDIQEQFGLTVGEVNWTFAIPALGLAVGPLIWSSLADIYGRRLIFIVGTVIALAATIGVAKAPKYSGYMAGRFFQGFGVSPASTVGLAIINDIFFEYQRGFKTGMWVLALDMGLLVGPLIGGFMNLVSPAWINWLSAIFFAVILIIEIAFLPETLYPRNQMILRMPFTAGSAATADIEKTERRDSVATEVDLPRSKMLPFINVKPVPGMRHPKPWDAALRFVLTFKFLAVFLSVFFYSFAFYWWLLCVITMLPIAYETYQPHIQGLLFIGLILGTLFSELFTSGKLSDIIIRRLVKKNNGIKTAEMRLWLAYPAAFLSALGLIIWGISIDKGYHWMVGQVAFFLFAAGIQMGNTVIAAYVVDCYPLQSMSMITFYAVLLNFSAFASPFFIAPYVDSVGFTWTFASQGIFTFFVTVPAIAGIHYFGGRIRAKNGQPSWVNPEYDTLI
ncbi:major facilitator superfamily transporter [Patellaria atrata CBS 101060]|uniref:Major facilitator superfamily transporter n=1 Tax=Patellaria atrata CBS 101060 TaxID=1346257 RepID=A0A9P4SDB1_9PEZI|nr:major facilitator superfamily transporter [Patellaria atrata CBS 101060]